MGRCPGCDARISWYRAKPKEFEGSSDLDLDLAKRIISEASESGFKKIVLSGGEPTSYPYLLDIVRFAKAHNFIVKLNTNGWSLPNLIDDLHHAGLDSIALSLYSLDRSTYFLLRGHYGMFARALKAVDSLSVHRKIYPDTFSAILQTIITKVNFRDLPRLLKLAIENKFSAFATSYLEDAYRHPEIQMSTQDIHAFHEDVIPELLSIMDSYPLTPSARQRNMKTLQSYFSPEINTIKNWAQGIYRPLGQSDCGQPGNFLLMYPGGAAAPCYGFEYTHVKDLMDTTLDKAIGDVINGGKFRAFTKTSFDFCHYCPIGFHLWLDLSQ